MNLDAANTMLPRRGFHPVRPDLDAVREARAHLAEFPTESLEGWMRTLDEIFTSYAKKRGYRRYISQWTSILRISQWLPIGGGCFRPISDADVLRDSDFQKIPAFESLLREISQEPTLSMFVVVSLLIDRDATWNDARSVNVGAAHLAAYRPILAQQQHEAYQKREQKRRAAGKGGRARAKEYAVPKNWVISTAERLNRDRSLTHEEKMSHLFSKVPFAPNGLKPSKSVIYRWLKAANIRL